MRTEPYAGTKHFRYVYGNPSWHQINAGHYIAGSIILEHTHAQHVAFMGAHKAFDMPIPYAVTREPGFIAYPVP